MEGFVYRFFYKCQKKGLWRNYISKLRSRRPDYIRQKNPAIKTDINLELENYYVPLVRCSGHSLPFKINTMSLITALSVTEHILEEKRDSFYNEISQVLEEDGYPVIQRPDRHFPVEQHSFIPFVGYLAVFPVFRFPVFRKSTSGS